MRKKLVLFILLGIFASSAAATPVSVPDYYFHCDRSEGKYCGTDISQNDNQTIQIQDSFVLYHNVTFPRRSEITDKPNIHFYPTYRFNETELRFSDGCHKTTVIQEGDFYKVGWVPDSSKWYCRVVGIETANLFEEPSTYLLSLF